MLSDGTWTYTWEHGRELTSMSDGTTTWCYEYNADGLRTKRSNGTTTYEYIYNGSSLVQMTVGDDTLYFAPDSVIYNGATYYYVTNIQGDVVEILDARGYTVVIYNYDAWGNILTTSGSMANTLGKINPIRYRGYVYDTETRRYYLQSRYYDPEIGRFINADDTAYLVADRTLLSYNLFAYCKNNPVTGCDPTGHFGLVGAIIATSAIVGGLLGAFSAAATGGNVLEGAIEGCLTGALGATCGLFLNPLVAGAVAFVGGAIIDIGTQAATQYITTQEVNLEEIDPWRAAKVGLETSIGAVIPALGDAAGNAVDAFDTALIWAEASTIITCVDVAVTNTVTATHTSTRKASTNQCSIAIHGRKMLLI